MKDKELYDFLDELTAPDNKKIEEISRRYPVLDKSAKRRIAKLCEEKMSMKNNEYNTQETNDYETVNNVEEYKKPRWYSRPAFAVAASLVLIAGITGAAIAGLSKMDKIETVSTIESMPPENKEMSESIKKLEADAAALADSFNTIEKIYGGNITKDENQKYAYNGTEYAKVTDSRFTSTDDVKAFMESCLTNEFIAERYPAMFKSEQPWLIDADGALYIKSAARGAGYAFTGNPQIFSDTADENSATMKIAYDNYGQTDMLVFKVKNDSGKWKIDSFESTTITEVPTEATTATETPVTTAEYYKSTDSSVEINTNLNIQDNTEVSLDATESSTESAVISQPQNSGDFAISTEKAYEFMHAINIIDQLGGYGIDIDYDTSDYFDSHDGSRCYRITEPGFSCVADVRNYMTTYLTDSYIANRYAGLLDTDTPFLVDITTDNDPTPHLYWRCPPKSCGAQKGCGFQWTGKEPIIEKQTDDMYTILAEYDNYGSPETMAMIIIPDTDGTWKINMITFGL